MNRMLTFALPFAILIGCGEQDTKSVSSSTHNQIDTIDVDGQKMIVVEQRWCHEANEPCPLLVQGLLYIEPNPHGTFTLVDVAGEPLTYDRGFISNPWCDGDEECTPKWTSLSSGDHILIETVPSDEVMVIFRPLSAGEKAIRMEENGADDARF